MQPKRKVLTASFFDRSTLVVARELVGKFLVRKIGKREVALMIVETEAYDGHHDKASHAHRGQTARNTPMFARPGTVYVYFTYGMHWMLNLVCGKEKYPAAVLIRGLESATEALRFGEMNGSPTPARSASVALGLDGPAKLTKFLQIDKKLNSKPLGKKTGLWVEDKGVAITQSRIRRTPRISIDSAGEYAKKPWRFVLAKR